MTTRRITERVSRPFAGSTVDRDKGVICDVLICGSESANGRDYLPAAFGTGKQYEGRPVYANHGRERKVEDKLGWFANVRVQDGKPRGDFHALKTHPLYDRLMESAERNPALFGFSHVATCKTRRGANGREAVESVETVESVDLVADPATTKGFYEGTAVAKTFREVLEAAAPGLAPDRKRAAYRLLAEDDMAPVMDSGVPDEASDIESGMRAVLLAILDDDSLATDEKLKRLRLALNMKDKLTGTADAAGDAEGDDGEGEEKPEEGRKPKDDAGTVREAIEVCRKVGFKGFDADDLDTIAAAPAARREAVARKLMGGTRADARDRPASAGRHGGQRIAERDGTDGGNRKVAETIPADPKAYKARIVEAG